MRQRLPPLGSRGGGDDRVGRLIGRKQVRAPPGSQGPSDVERRECFCFTRTMPTPAMSETIATVNKPPSRIERETVPRDGGPPFPPGPLPLPGKPFGGPLPLPGTADAVGANRASDVNNDATSVHRLDALPRR